MDEENKQINENNSLNKSNEKPNEEDDIAVIDENITLPQLILRILTLGSSIFFTMFLNEFRIILLFVFTRSYGLNNLEALSTFILIYCIFVIGFAWAVTQGYSFKSAEYFANKDYEKLGMITYQTFVISFIFAMFIALLLFFFCKPFFGMFISNSQAVDNLDTQIKLLSISVPFMYLQMALIRYFSAINSYQYFIYGSIVGLIVQLIVQFICITGFQNVNVGIGLSNSLGNIALFLFTLICYLKKNQCSESLIPFVLKDCFDGMWNYIKYCFPLFILSFLTLLSYDLIVMMSLILGDQTYTAYSIIINLLTYMYICAEAFSSASNVFVFYSIGIKNVALIKRVIISTTIILSAFCLFFCIIITFFDTIIFSIFTNIPEVINIASSLKWTFIIAIILLSFHIFISEALTALGYEIFPIYTLLLGRYIITFGLSLLFAKVMNVGNDSVLLALVIGQALILLVNCIMLNKAIIEFSISDSPEEEEVKSLKKD